MNGRELKQNNDLFYVCSLIGYIARKTKNHPGTVVRAIGENDIRKFYELAEVYHCDNIDKVADQCIESHHIETGNFDNVALCEYSIPTHWDIGKVYKRLILAVAKEENKDVVSALMEVYATPITDLIEDYNSSFYYDSPNCIFATYCNSCNPILE